MLPVSRVRVHGVYSQLCHWPWLWLQGSCLTLFLIQLVCEADLVMFNYLKDGFSVVLKVIEWKVQRKSMMMLMVLLSRGPKQVRVERPVDRQLSCTELEHLWLLNRKPKSCFRPAKSLLCAVIFVAIYVVWKVASAVRHGYNAGVCQFLIFKTFMTSKGCVIHLQWNALHMQNACF